MGSTIDFASRSCAIGRREDFRRVVVALCFRGRRGRRGGRTSFRFRAGDGADVQGGVRGVLARPEVAGHPGLGRGAEGVADREARGWGNLRLLP